MGRLLRWLLLALVLANGVPSYAEDGPFVPESLRVPGRPVEVTPARFGERAGGFAEGLIVACVAGTPPDEVRRLAFFPPDGRGRYAAEPAGLLELPADVVAYDLVPEATGPGDRVALLASNAIVLLSPLSDLPRTRLPLEPRAPLPPRTREVARLRFMDAWDGRGVHSALVPTLTGARLVALGAAGAPARTLELPLLAEYAMAGPGPPSQDELLKSWIEWPTLALGEDDGDGRSDLFALSRFGVWIFHGGPEGLPASPSRRLALRAFTPAEELRYKATALLMIASDLNGDGRTDLVVHHTSGTLLKSRSVTAVHLNPGSGVRLDRPPDVLLDETDGLASIDARDLDGDGKQELVQSKIAFGIVQVARALALRRAEVDLRVYPLTRTDGTPPVPSWSGSVSLPLDFAQGRVEGLLPTAQGDWNGDGRRDLMYGLARDEIALHLGVAGATGPGFGPRIATQHGPAEGSSTVSDLDGDGLDDLIVYDPRDTEGKVHVLRNAGTLPGTPPSLRRVGGGADAPAKAPSP